MTTVPIVIRQYKRHKKRIHSVAVPGLVDSLQRLRELPNDIKVILDSGKTRACLARSLGVSSVTTWRWQRGQYFPRDQLVLLGLLAWADEIKNKKPEVK